MANGELDHFTSPNSQHEVCTASSVRIKPANLIRIETKSVGDRELLEKAVEFEDRV